MEQGISCWWVRAKQNSVNQMFPAGAFTKHIDTRPIERHKPPKLEVPKVEKPSKHPDAIAQLLAEAQNVEGILEIAKLAGLELSGGIKKSQTPGLMRMRVGNILRHKWKKGEFDPASIIWTNEKGFVTAP